MYNILLQKTGKPSIDSHDLNSINIDSLVFKLQNPFSVLCSYSFPFVSAKGRGITLNVPMRCLPKMIRSNLIQSACSLANKVTVPWRL